MWLKEAETVRTQNKTGQGHACQANTSTLTENGTGMVPLNILYIKGRQHESDKLVRIE